MTGHRDEFAAATKQVLALRAAHRCSLCRTLTVRPHTLTSLPTICPAAFSRTKCTCPESMNCSAC